MPSLGPRNYEPEPKSPEEQELIEQLEQLKLAAVEKMLEILKPSLPSYRPDSSINTQKVMYKTEDQDERVWTRAWLQGSSIQSTTRDGYYQHFIGLFTDSVRDKDDGSVRDVTSECEHFRFQSNEHPDNPAELRRPYITIKNHDYDDFNTAQRIEFMEVVLDTLELIQRVEQPASSVPSS